MSKVSFAESELRRAGLLDKDSDYDGALGECVLKMIDLFAEQGHSGASARAALDLFERLGRYEPLTPLTGDDDEWTEVGGDFFQNKRCPRVFKGDDGAAYDIRGRVFREPSGACFTNRDSRVLVQFPYTPTTEVVDVPERGEEPGV
jgi:hypothetical protein